MNLTNYLKIILYIYLEIEYYIISPHPQQIPRDSLVAWGYSCYPSLVMMKK